MESSDVAGCLSWGVYSQLCQLVVASNQYLRKSSAVVFFENMLYGLGGPRLVIQQAENLSRLPRMFIRCIKANK